MRQLSLATAAALALAPALAAAQSSVTLFGILDTSLNFASVHYPAAPNTSVRFLGSGLNGQSRIGFRGVEDLGGGYAALFHLESAVQSDTGNGTGTGGGLTFQRRSVVGLGGPFGIVWLGRDYTPGFQAASPADVAFVVGWQYGLYGTTLLNWTADGTASRGIRWDNGIHYVSPTLFGGLVVRAAYSLGENASPNGSRGNNAGLSARYDGGPLQLFAYAHEMKDPVLAPATGTTTHQRGFGGAYNFGMVRVSAGQQENNPAGPAKYVGRNLGVAVKAGANGWLMGQVHRIKEDASGAVGTTYALSYVYSMSKRTDLTVSAGRQRNNTAGTFALRASDFQVAPTAGGASISGIGFGLSHKF
jgi:predicted porin